ALPTHRQMEFRIGINLGDVMVEGEQIYGDGVNIAARLESLAEAGGICISGTVHEQIENKLSLRYEDLGEQTVKNITKPVRVWRIRMAVPSPLVGETCPEPSRRSQGEAPSGRAGAVQTSHLDPPSQEGKEPTNRRVSIAHFSRTALVVVGLLIVGGIVTL